MNQIKANKINLILETENKIKNDQSNDTYSNVIIESTRKTPVESFIPRRLIAKSTKNRINSTSLINIPFDNGENRLKGISDNDTSNY